MKLLVTGGQGMAGHVMVRYLRRLPGFQVAYTTRDGSDREGLLADARDTVRIRGIIETFRPDAVINCIGVLNQFAEADPVNAYRVNGIFPHDLAEAALGAGAGLFISARTVSSRAATGTIRRMTCRTAPVYTGGPRRLERSGRPRT